MSLEDITDSWQLLAGLRCHHAVHMDRVGRMWGAWGVHSHSVPSLVIPLAGCSLLDIDDHHILPLTPGEVVLLAPWVWHVNRRPHPGGQTLLVSRTGDYAEVEVWRDEGTWYGDLPWSLVDRDIQALASARTETGRRNAGDRLLAALAASTPVRRNLPPALQRMCSFAWRMRTQPITAAEILATSGLSYSVAHQLFVSRFGETPKQYLLRSRLDLARTLLLEGGQPGTVWREAGFASRADLTRRFRLVHGMAPLAWLRRNRLAGREMNGPAPAGGAGPDAGRDAQPSG